MRRQEADSLGVREQRFCKHLLHVDMPQRTEMRIAFFSKGMAMRVLTLLQTDRHCKARIGQTDFANALGKGNVKEIPKHRVLCTTDGLAYAQELSGDVRVEPVLQVHNIGDDFGPLVRDAV